MKHIFIFIVVLIVSFSQRISAQEPDCATTIPAGVTVEQAQSGDLNLYKRTDFTPPLRLAIHVVQYSDGTGGISQNNLDQKIIDLRYFFEQALFEFYIFKVDSIDNDQYASIDNFDEADELRTINEVASCINVYFVPLFPGYNGLSSFSPRIQDPVLQSEQGIIIRNEAPGTTLPHEMGHFFDLFHTYEKTSREQAVVPIGALMAICLDIQKLILRISSHSQL